MKRPVLTTFLVLAAAFTAGCPVYDHENAGCFVDQDCATGYFCDTNTGTCYAPVYQQPTCIRPADCLSSQTCTVSGVCADGDCSFHGSQCVAGYVCAHSTGVWACELGGASGAGGSSGSAGQSGTGGSTAGEAGALDTDAGL